MAQPAVTKNPLGILSLWQKASADPPIEWEKWNQQLFLGIIPKDGIDLSKLLQNPPAVRRPQEPGYELPIVGETNVQIRDRNLHNQEKKVTWENQWAHLDNLGPTVDGVPWDEADINVEVTSICVWELMANDKVQKDLLAETKTPNQALEYAIRREKGLEHRIAHPKTGISTEHANNHSENGTIWFHNQEGQ